MNPLANKNTWKVVKIITLRISQDLKALVGTGNPKEPYSVKPLGPFADS